MTRKVALAIATDAGNQRMPSYGRTIWSVDDYNHAAGEFERLWPLERDMEGSCDE